MAEKAGAIAWILDGLDEVPPTAGRSQVLEIVRAVVCDPARSADGVLVSTRPQGYEGELDDLDTVALLPLPGDVSLGYAERLVRAWSSQGAPVELVEHLDKLRSELGKPEVEELVQTPLHTTMAALLVATRGSLPSARSLLFEHYFTTILRRELGKPVDHGIRDEDQGVIRALHAQAGLALHVRSQAQTGARSSLRRREIRSMLTSIHTELGMREDDARASVDRIMRFAAERLVLLLHAAEGEYEFGVRSLQEFFAAHALGEGPDRVVRTRLDAIALDPHWSNVLAFVVSGHALRTGKVDRERALLLAVSLCRALNTGEVGGEAAARCLMGSRLAIQMLRETERYGYPWLHDPLWEIALDAAHSPSQCAFALAAREMGGGRRAGGWTDVLEIHTRLGLLAARWPDGRSEGYRQRVIEKAEALLARGGDDQLSGWRLIYGGLLVEHPEAIRVANAHLPSTPKDALDIWAAIADDDRIPLPRWLHEFVATRPESFSVARVALGYVPMEHKNVPVVFQIVSRMSSRPGIYLRLGNGDS
jgi:hypothetical protein